MTWPCSSEENMALLGYSCWISVPIKNIGSDCSGEPPEASKGQAVGREQKRAGVTLVPMHRQYGMMACQSGSESIAVPLPCDHSVLKSHRCELRLAICQATLRKFMRLEGGTETFQRYDEEKSQGEPQKKRNQTRGGTLI